MWLEFFFRGSIIGFISTVPLGAIGILCIQRTLSKNQRSGFISGLGAATADLCYATMALFFLALIEPFVNNHMVVLKIIAGLFIASMGINIFFKNPIIQIRRNRTGKSNPLQDYISVFLLTLTNPAPLIAFVGLFAAFGLSSEIGELNGVAMLTGVFSGAVTWWFLLTFIVNLIRKKFRPRHLLWMNRISGTVIALLGLFLVLSIVFKVNINIGGISI